jgi:hypothetical protein
MGSDTEFGSARSADRGNFWEDPAPLDASPEGATYRLTTRAAFTVVVLLSIGLWAAIWAAVASLASAALG